MYFFLIEWIAFGRVLGREREHGNVKINLVNTHLCHLRPLQLLIHNIVMQETAKCTKISDYNMTINIDKKSMEKKEDEREIKEIHNKNYQ